MKDVYEVQTWIDKFGEDQLNLDNLKDYLEFVKSAENNRDPERYSEWHHVMPKCLDKEKEYVKYARLNGADHLRAHMKLVECFSGTVKSKLAYTLCRMNPSTREYVSLEEWEKAVEIARKYRTREYLSTSQRQKISDNAKLRVGSLNPMYGKSLSKESLDKRVASFKFTIEKKKKNGTYKSTRPCFKIYNDGVREYHIYPDEVVPDGLILGCLGRSEETCKKMSESQKIRYSKMTKDERKVCCNRFATMSKDEMKIVRTKMSLTMKKYVSSLSEEEKYDRFVKPRLKENLDQETREKMSESASKRNSGRVWVNNGTVNKFIYLEDLKNYEGFHIGRIVDNSSKKGKIHITDGKYNRLIDPNREEIPDGWYRGITHHED